MRANAGFAGVFIVGMAIFIAIFAGLVSAVIPWWAALILFSPPILLWAGVRWPLIALMLMLLILFGIIPLGGTRGTDVVVMLFTLVMTFLHREHIGKVFARSKSQWLILMALMVWTGGSIIYAHFYRQNQLAFIYEEAMSIAYWLVLIPTALIAHNEKKASTALKIIVAMSAVLAAMSVAQSITGMRLSFSNNAKVAEISSLDGGIEGLSRSYMPGILLVMFSFVLSLANLLKKSKSTLVWFILLLITAAGIYVSFGRAVWGATALASVIVAMLSGRAAFGRFTLLGTVTVALLTTLLWVVKPDLVTGTFNRVLSTQQEGRGPDSSLGWRLIENQYAKIAIEDNPILGLGVGGEYKPRLVDMRLFADQTHYIHNGYYYIMTKIGIVGFIIYMMNYFNIFAKIISIIRTSGQVPPAHSAMASIYLVVLALSFTQPELMTGSSIICLVIIASFVLPTGQESSKSISKVQAVHTRPRPAHTQAM